MNDGAVFQAALVDWNKGGFAAFAGHLAPDVVWHAPPEYPEGDVWHGREAITAAWHAQFESVFDSYETEIMELESGPRAWFSATRTNGYARGSRMTLDWTNYFVGTTEHGMINELWVFQDRDQARAKAGFGA
jgi:ketosteroid isomerase-like protein